MSITDFPQGIRQRPTLGYRSVIKTTLINALRAVYTSDYYEQQFQSLRITGEWSFTKVNYPVIIVKFTSSKVEAAGIGHIEYFKDSGGTFQAWDHRRFEGMVEFQVVTLSPLDLDILLDSINEIIGLGRLDDLLTQFYYTIYGEPGTLQPFATQISLNSDVVTDSGAPSVSPAPWQPEDVMIYQASLICDVHGGFYNISPGRAVTFVQDVTQTVNLAYLQDVDLVYRPDLQILGPPFDYTEDPQRGLVTSTGVPSGIEGETGQNFYGEGTYGVMTYG